MSCPVGARSLARNTVALTSHKSINDSHITNFSYKVVGSKLLKFNKIVELFCTRLVNTILQCHTFLVYKSGKVSVAEICIEWHV